MNTIPSSASQAQTQDVVSGPSPDDIDRAVTAAFSVAFRKHGALATEAPKPKDRASRPGEGEGAE